MRNQSSTVKVGECFAFALIFQSSVEILSILFLGAPLRWNLESDGRLFPLSPCIYTCHKCLYQHGSVMLLDQTSHGISVPEFLVISRSSVFALGVGTFQMRILFLGCRLDTRSVLRPHYGMMFVLKIRIQFAFH